MPYNRNIYIIDWIKLVTEKTPYRWRDVYILVWLRSLAAVANDLYNRFMFFRAGVKYRLLITPQVCYLEKALNDRYDVVNRGIFITDGTEFLPMVLFRKSENKKIVLHTKAEGLHQILYTKAETAQFSVDFIVNIPAGVVFDLTELRAFVTVYKLTTKTFKVKLI